MTDFEVALATALRAESQEIAMDTDQLSAAEVLESRLDRADRHRRRSAVVTALAAAAAVALVVLGLRTVGAPDGAAPSVSTPSPSPSAYTFYSLPVPLSMDLPAPYQQATGGLTDYAAARAAYVEWCDAPAHGSTCMTLAAVEPQHVVSAAGRRIAVASAADYVQHLQQLAASGAVSLADLHTGAVGGSTATFVRVTGLQQVEGDLACGRAAAGLQVSTAVDCDSYDRGMTFDVAVVDLRVTTALLWQAEDVADPAPWRAAFEPAVTTLRLAR